MKINIQRFTWKPFLSILLIIVAMLAASSILFGPLSLTFAVSSNKGPGKVIHSDQIIPTPTPPSGNALGLSATSGTPGTHVFMSASGYTPGETVQGIWNYKGPGTGLQEKSFYLFNPNATADANGVVNESLFTPLTITGTYTIAAVGAKSNVVRTATFQSVPSLDLGIYTGQPGTVLRFNGWGLGYREEVKLYWNWSPTNNGQFISNAVSDTKGDFSKRTFTIPSGTTDGTYTVAAIGTTSGAIAQAQFTVGTLTLGGQPGSADWSNFGFDQQNTRVNPNEWVISSANVSTLSIKWKSATPVPYNVVGSAVIANGIVYIGTIEGIVIAYNATNGNVLWTFYARGPIYGSPTIQNGIAYFGSVNYPSEDLIGNFAYALNVTDGSLIWENYLIYGGEWIAPTVVNGVVYYSSAHKEGVSGGYSAFDAYTGATLWSFSTPYGMWAPASFDPTGTNLYIGTANPCNSSSNPANCAGYVEDLNPATGAVIWQIHLAGVSGDDDIPNAPLYSNGRLYIGGKNGIFYCLDATNGNILWQYNTGSSGDYGIFSSATIYNNMVFFGGGDRLVHALNIGDGSVAWTFKTGSLVTSSPAIANGVLYIGSYDKNIYALNPTTGSMLWSATTGAPVWSSPSISNGVLYVSGGDGYVYAFSPGGV